MKEYSLNQQLHEATSIAAVWELYRTRLIPADAPKIQVIETRRSFYAGIDWLYKRLLRASEDELRAEQLLSKIGKELDEYVRNL